MRRLVVPVTYCSDRNVQSFVEHEMSLITPYSTVQNTKTARQVFEEARKQFGDMRCWDLTINQH
jgi:hypothetical protein